eukprot:346983_1
MLLLGGLGLGGSLLGGGLGGTSLVEGGKVSLLAGDLLAVEKGVLALAGNHAGLGDGGEELAAGGGGLADASDGGLDLADAAGANGGGDEALDLGGLEAGLLAVLVDLTADNEATDVVLAAKVEELADLVGALGAEAAGHGDVGDTLDGGLAGLDDGDVDAGDVLGEDAAADGLATALTVAAAEGVEGVVAALDQEGDTGGGHDALDHGETLLVGATLEAEEVTLELITEDGTIDVVAEAVVGEVDAAEDLVGDLDLLEGAVAGVSDVKLHSYPNKVQKL